MSETIVDRLYDEFKSLVELLDRHTEPSLRSTADDCFRKALLLSAASHFEKSLTQSLLLWVEETSSANERLVELVRRQAISRQYHKLFDWDVNNPNRFFGLFGESFKIAVREWLRKDEQLSRSASAFLELGRERNRLVHQDFGNFALEKTAGEIFGLYKEAVYFVDAIPYLLRRQPDSPAHLVGDMVSSD